MHIPIRLARSVRWVTAGAALLAALAALSQKPGPLRSTYDQGAEGWVAVGPPTGVPARLSIEAVDGAEKALAIVYTPEPRKFAGIMHPVSGLVGQGLRVRLRTSVPGTYIIGCIERDGSSYHVVIQMMANEWKTVETAFADLQLSDDGKDENGRLDIEQVGAVVIADAAGFLPTTHTERTLWIDEAEFGIDISQAALEPYRPLLLQGPPSPSGATATAGMSYVPGRFGRAILADAPGEVASVRLRDEAAGPWRWEQGTIEFRIRPTRAMSVLPDFTGLATMQREPFAAGFRSGLHLFVSQGRQIVFMLNGDLGSLAASGPMTWRVGEWLSLAATWGPAGMRLYVDGERRGSGPVRSGPASPARDLVIGGQAWTMMARGAPACAFDDLRVSSRQHTDDEIKAAARSNSPMERGADTLALEPFDGLPAPPPVASGGRAPWNTFAPGAPIKLAFVPPAESGALVTVRRPGGAVVRKGRADRRGESAALPAIRQTGFYAIEADGRPAGWIRVASSRARPRFPLSGASACFADAQESEEYFRMARAAGVTMLRMPFEWFEIEPSEGRFVWDKYDRIVQHAVRNRVELIPTFIWEKPQPSWAGPGEAKSGLNSERHPPTDMARWRRFVSAVVARYRDRIRWWIPANEPNMARYWHPKPDAVAYTALLRETYGAVRAVDPEARILGLSLAGINLRFMEECFKAGALRYCDAVGIHPYICPRDPDERGPVDVLDPTSATGTFREGLRMAGAMIRRYGGKQRLWLDEAGQPYRDDFVSPSWGAPEPKAAAVLAKEMVEAMSSGFVDRVLWFTFFGGEYGSFALVRPDGSPTLPLVAYLTVGDMLAGATSSGDGKRGPGIESRLFRRGSSVIEVVWAPSGTRTLELAPRRTAYDVYGFPLARGPVHVGSTPIYIVGR